MSNQNNCEPVAASANTLRIFKMATFGERVFELITNNYDSLDETCDKVMEIALKVGLVEKVPYDPEVHGEEFEVDPGDDIWWWGGRNL